MIKIGIIGTGFGVTGQLASFKQLPKCEVVALCGKDPEKTAKLAKENNVKKSFSDYLELLKDKDIDLVTIATPDNLHKPMFLNALKFDKHIIVEKPAGINSQEIQEMLTTAKDFKKLVIVDHPLRFNPVVVKIRELIEAGYFGQVTNITINQYTNYGSDENNPHRWHDTKAGGGGQILLMGTHIIDLGRYIAGMPKVLQGNFMLHRNKENKVNPEGKLLPVEVEEQITGNFLMEGNIIVNFFNTMYSFGYKNFELRIHGSRGLCLYDDIEGMRISNNNAEALKKVELNDPLIHIKAGRSFVSSSFKYFADTLIKHLNGELYDVHFCTLQEALENMLYLEKMSKMSNFKT
jgi:predicted dehydrogenase